MGGVYAVKPLGVYAMVDDGEVDWKVVCIRADDPKAGAVHDVEVCGGVGWVWCLVWLRLISISARRARSAGLDCRFRGRRISGLNK